MCRMSILNFERFITPLVIKWLWLSGSIIITVSGLTMFNVPPSYGIISTGAYNLIIVLVIIFGNVMWRVVCEYFLIQFKIHGTLEVIEKNTEKKA